MNKKLFFYEVEPKYFKDSTGNGCGDLKGLADKFDYFKYLGVDAINLPNLLSAYSDDADQGFKSVAKTYGTIADLQKVISLAKSRKIKILVELNIGSIRETHKWFQNATNKATTFTDVVDFKPNKKEEITEGEYRYDDKTKSYYIVHEQTQEVVLNWSSEETLKKFVDVVKFWNDLGVEGFVFTNFEQINYGGTGGEFMTDETLRQLRKFYRAIKEINDKIVVVGKSSKLDAWAARDYTQGATKVFDYTQLTAISLLGTSKQFGTDKIGKFTQGALVKRISRLVSTNNNILTFGSPEVGRITSRWGDDNQYHAESAKAIALLLLTTSGSSSIYYGDELGIKNIGLTHLDDFQDKTLNERKRALANQKVSEKDFMEAQVLQNSINARSLMPWNPDKNGGFSVSDKTITPVSEQYRHINVELQFADEYSPLNFYKRVISLSKTSKFKAILNQGTYKIGSQKLGLGVIHIIRSFGEQEVHFLINFTNKEKNVSCPKNGGKVQFSTYGHKKYSELPKSLLPFEGIVITKETDEQIKLAHTQEVELAKQEKLKAQEKEKAKKAREHEKQILKEEQERAAKQAEEERIWLIEDAKREEAERIAEQEKEALRRSKDAQKATEAMIKEEQAAEREALKIQHSLQKDIAVQEKRHKEVEKIDAFFAEEEQKEQERIQKREAEAKLAEKERAHLRKIKETQQIEIEILREEEARQKEFERKEKQVKHERERQLHQFEKQEKQEQHRLERQQAHELKRALKEAKNEEDELIKRDMEIQQKSHISNKDDENSK